MLGRQSSSAEERRARDNATLDTGNGQSILAVAKVIYKSLPASTDEDRNRGDAIVAFLTQTSYTEHGLSEVAVGIRNHGNRLAPAPTFDFGGHRYEIRGTQHLELIRALDDFRVTCSAMNDADVKRLWELAVERARNQSGAFNWVLT